MVGAHLFVEFKGQGSVLIEEIVCQESRLYFFANRAEFLAKMDDLYLKYGVTMEEAAHGDD